MEKEKGLFSFKLGAGKVNVKRSQKSNRAMSVQMKAGKSALWQQLAKAHK